MKKFFMAVVTACVLLALTIGVSAETLNGTLVRTSSADPWVFYHDGQYYLVRTGSQAIPVHTATSAVNFPSSYTVVYRSGTYVTEEVTNEETNEKTEITRFVVSDENVEAMYDASYGIDGTWSPEIHYFSEEDFGEEYAGWYMFLGLRRKPAAGDTHTSRYLRMVVLKSTTDSPKGPYGHPVPGENYLTKNYSQPLLNKDGSEHADWGCGQTILRIREGQYKGIYAMWVAEEGRGLSGTTGEFYQKIMIAKMENPWTLSSEPGVITTPTQSWEMQSATSKHPRVVEGATPVYGEHGEIFLTYSGDGYQNDYGIGQITWTGEDPLLTTSWVKLPDTTAGDERLTVTNPIFQAPIKDGVENTLVGVGHASFLTDMAGNGFLCYHAYPYDAESGKADGRNSYIESYYIDYTKWNGHSYGVIIPGFDKDGSPANTSTTFDFVTDGSPLAAATVEAVGGKVVTLTMQAENATGYMIYRSTDGEVFDYIGNAGADGNYTDADVNASTMYDYRVYAFRNEEIAEVSNVAECMTTDERDFVDVLKVLKYIAGDETAATKDFADIDKNGVVNLADALETLRWALES